MHILFSPTIAALRATDRDDLIEFLDEVARSAQRGYHRFTIGRSVGNWCIENLPADASTKRRIVQLSESFAPEKQKYDEASVKLRVQLGLSEPALVTRGLWEMGHQSVIGGYFLEPTQVVVEDATADGHFLKFLLEAEARRLRFGAVKFALVNGGGSGTSREFRRTIEGSKVTVCICDHDQLNPYGSRSQTNLRCRAIERRASGSYVGALVELPAREIENILPLDVIGLLPQRGLKQEHAILRSLITGQENCNQGDCLWLYFDVKNGLEKDKVIRACASEEACAWATRKYRLANIEELRRLSVPGFGEGIPAAFLESGAAQKHFIEFTKGAYWQRHFTTWVSNLLDFVAGAEKRRT